MREDYDIAERLGREPAFPIYKLVIEMPTAVPKDYEPGRVIIAGHTDHELGVLTDQAIEEWFGPNDIVLVPLYEGAAASCGPGTSARRPSYEGNIAAMERLSGKVKGVTYGNAFAEFTYKYRLWTKPRLGHRAVNALAAHELWLMAQVARDHGDHRFWCGFMDIDACIDAYFPTDGRYLVRDVANELGVGLITYCGYTMFGGAIPESEPIKPVPESVLNMCPIHEEHPKPLLSSYIAGADWITGVGHLEGLMKQNDALLHAHGFSAGLLGVF